uniref:neurochondrin isoform X2 n=1 Tax=Myxine glutinosa TaxID=7769 RepID=UPI00358E3AB1
MALAQGVQSVPPTLERCLKLLKEPKNDSEQFALLLLITKLVRAEDTDTQTRRRIFDAIGFTFLNRLLSTSCVQEGCSQEMYRGLALTLLACFCTDPDLSLHPQVTNKIPVFCDVLCSDSALADETDATTRTSTVNDACQCVKALCDSAEGRRHLVMKGAIPLLCTAILKRRMAIRECEDILRCLLDDIPEKCWKRNEDCLLSTLESLSLWFCECEDAGKFEVCEVLVSLLPPREVFEKQKDPRSFCGNIYSGLSAVLHSRLGDSHRESAMKLASRMLVLYDVAWIVEANESVKMKFLSLIVNLACIEVRMHLEDRDMQAVLDKRHALLSSYSILEIAITLLAATEFETVQSWCVQVLLVMQEAFLAIVHFLKQEGEQQMAEPFIFASVRVLAAWMAEESCVLQRDVLTIIPFLVRYSRRLHNGGFEADSLTSKMAGLTFSPSELAPSMDVLRLLLPGFCHLSAEEDSRKALIQNEMHVLLKDYLKKHLEMSSSLLLDNVEKRDQWETSLGCLCGILLNLVVSEVELVRKDDMFERLLEVLIKHFPTFIRCGHFMVLRANLTALGLMLSRVLAGSPLLSDPGSRDFFRACIHHLSEAYRFEDVHKDGTTLTISAKYRPVWPEISDLWLLAVQALSECFDKLPGLALLVLECGWLEHVCSLLTAGCPAVINAEVVHVLQSLLVEAEHHSDECREYMNNNDTVLRCMSRVP